MESNLEAADAEIVAQELQAVVRDSNPIEQARAFRRVRGYGFSKRRIAAFAGCSEAHVRNMLGLLDLPAAAQSTIASGEPYRPYLSASKEASQAETLDLESAATNGSECLGRWCKQLELAGGYACRGSKKRSVQSKVLKMVLPRPGVRQEASALRTTRQNGKTRVRRGFSAEQSLLCTFLCTTVFRSSL